MMNSGGSTLMQRFDEQQKRNEDAINELRNTERRLRREFRNTERRLEKELDQVKRGLRLSYELTEDFLSLRRGELEYWKTSDKTKRRVDLIRARDEVAYGGQVIADIITIEQRTNSDISYTNCFAEAYGISLADAKSRLPDGPSQIRQTINILCSIRKLDAWQHSVRQTDYRDIEKIAVDLIARFLRTDPEAGKRLFAPGSGCRDLYGQMISLYDKWK
jgi:hypothetical protein